MNTNWPEKTIESWEHFDGLVGGMGRISLGSHRMILFRGQSQCWANLKPSLARMLMETSLSDEQGLKIEDMLLQGFASQAHLYIDVSEICAMDVPIEWWTLMQHYGAPTRLLDWTLSPYVAAYFAAKDDPKDDGEIWAVCHQEFVQYGDNVDLNTHDWSECRDGLMFSQAGRESERSAAQQSWCSVGFRPAADHAQLIHSILGTQTKCSGPFHMRFTLPKELKADFVRRLRHLNVTARSLFPGVTGLARGMEELAQITARELKD